MTGSGRSWFDAVGVRLRRLVRLRVASAVADRPDECEAVSDLTQEAMATAAERFDEFRGTSEAELVSWVCSIAATKLSDHRRSVRRKRRDVRRTRSLGEMVGDVPDGAEPPEDVLLQEEEREFVLGLIDGLPEIERKAVRLRYLEGRPVKEVAAYLYRSDGGAAAVLKRALARLRHRARMRLNSGFDWPGCGAASDR